MVQENRPGIFFVGVVAGISSELGIVVVVCRIHWRTPMGAEEEARYGSSVATVW